MTTYDDRLMETVLAWCADVMGPFTVDADHSREHAGNRASAVHLRTPVGGCYVKIHRDRSHWENEVYAYERWAPAFGNKAPKLLAVRDVEPLALIISELSGKILEDLQLAESQEQAVWLAAGKALAALHGLEAGESFGPCHRDGSPTGKPIRDAREYVNKELDNWLERGVNRGFLNPDELAIVQSARRLIPAFTGEQPTPCHRDYCPANWLVSEAGVWTGVIDFEFAYWDVWVSDFARDPFWTWIQHPIMMEAFRAGYGRAFTPKDEEQLLIAHLLYALGAVVWGEENDYHIYANEGRQALTRIGEILANKNP